MQEAIASLKDRIEKAKHGIGNLKAKREEYIALLNRISNNISNITDDITHNELSLEYLNDELKKVEDAIKQEKET